MIDRFLCLDAARLSTSYDLHNEPNRIGNASSYLSTTLTDPHRGKIADAYNSPKPANQSRKPQPKLVVEDTGDEF
jgi:hypothetical protein